MSPPQAFKDAKDTAYSKRSPPAAWKDSLRRACFDRIRQQRTNHNPHQPPSPQLSAQQVVAYESRQQGVSVRWPVVENHRHGNLLIYDEVDSLSMIPTNYSMSEEEWIELLEEVEQELDRSRCEHILLEQDIYLEDQIADYERWQQEKEDSELTIPCPICYGRLSQTAANEIVCPNSMDGSCSMQLLDTRVSLPELSDALQETIERHAVACSGIFAFERLGERLVATCSTCLGRDEVDI
jgi:hypothetical protein